MRSENEAKDASDAQVPRPLINREALCEFTDFDAIRGKLRGLEASDSQSKTLARRVCDALWCDEAKVSESLSRETPWPH